MFRKPQPFLLCKPGNNRSIERKRGITEKATLRVSA